MDPVSPLPALACLLLALATSSQLGKYLSAPTDLGRHASIDGLRGYLAFFVFLHHACIWYFYLRTGVWTVPPSNLYTHFGQGGVALFFMITGFLFFSKLIEGRKRNIDWGKLFISRLLRLTPLYLFAMLLLAILVFIQTKGLLNEPLPELLKNTVKWLTFTVLGSPDLNQVNHTFTIIAGVTWSLPYEWFFYFALPVLALTVRARPAFRYLALSVLGMAIMVLAAEWYPQPHHLGAFAGGIAAALIARLDAARKFSRKKTSSVILLGCFAIAVIVYPSTYRAAPLFLVAGGFTLIACGNNLFGILTTPASRVLGEMAYSIYLLHGIFLFVMFNHVTGLAHARALSPDAYWLAIGGITPALVIGSYITFRLIESPAMQSTTAMTQWLRLQLAARPGLGNRSSQELGK